MTKIIVPKLFEIALGQNMHGGGEYMGVASAWDTASKSADFFVQYYASNSYNSFKAKVAEQVQATACKSFLSVNYPEGGNLLDTLTEPDSPPQFHGRFDEIPFTTATVPPVSHYKVYYHIYAGKESRAVYSVYLKGGSESSFYQDTATQKFIDSGYIATGGTVDETKDFTSPAGYKQLCIRVNNQEECGFGSVSTDFAVNYVKDKYLEEQASETKVSSEKECIAGSPSLYSLLSPNAQSSAEEIVASDLYNQGIIRICATDNPGKGTDPYAGTATSRWREVGNCGNEKIKCWIDTQSVKDVIKFRNIENETLSTLTDNSLKLFGEEGKYLKAGEFSNKITEIIKEKGSKKPEEKINLINLIYDKVFFNNQKAQLLYLRGKAYSELAIKAYNSLTKISRTLSPVYTSEGTPLSTERLLAIQTIIDGKISPPRYDGEIDYSAGTWCAGYARVAAENLFGKKYSRTDAWCRRIDDKLVKEFENVDWKNNGMLRTLTNDGTLQRGMIVGTRPESCVNNQYCEKEQSCYNGKITAKVSHNLLYLGKDSNGELVFVESFYSGGPTLRKLSEFNRIVMEIYDAPSGGAEWRLFNNNNNDGNTEGNTGTTDVKPVELTLDSAIEYLNGYKENGYSDVQVKEKVDELCSKRLLSEIDCNEIEGEGFFNLEENVEYVLKILNDRVSRRGNWWTRDTSLVKVGEFIRTYGEVTYTNNPEVDAFTKQLMSDGVLKPEDIGGFFSPWDLITLKNILEGKSTRVPWTIDSAIARTDNLLKQNAPGDIVESFRQELIQDGVLSEGDFELTGKNLESIKVILAQKKSPPVRTPWTIDSALVEVDNLLRIDATSLAAADKFASELVQDGILKEEDFTWTGKNLGGIKTLLRQKKATSQ